MLNWFFIGLACALFIVYAWSFYNLPILVAGVKSFRKKGKYLSKKPDAEDVFPFFSIVVPMKNEENVVSRVLEAFSQMQYPADKKEVIVVEDGSLDKTVDVCRSFAKDQRLNLKVIHRAFSRGKPSALNAGIARAKGEIIAVFDADNVPAADALLNVRKYFDDQQVAAVQGRTFSINSKENMLTEIISREEDVWYEAYLRGKDALDLFVHLKGSCQFIRRDVLEEVGGFDAEALSEDMEFSAKMTERGYKIRYAPDVQALEESPSKLKQLFRQRTRWFRGTMDVALKYGRLMARPSRRSLDAELTLFGPIVLIVSLLAYIGTSYVTIMPFPLSVMLQFAAQLTALGATIAIFLCGLVLVYSSRPRKTSSLLWLPFIYFYWFLQTFIAVYAILLMVLRRPRRWLKTEKTGIISLGVEL